MKTALRWGLAPACVLALASAATADPITDLYDTGVITNGVLAPGGALDLHYSLVSTTGRVHERVRLVEYSQQLRGQRPDLAMDRARPEP